MRDHESSAVQASKLESALALALELPESDRRTLLDLIYESLPDDSDCGEYRPEDVAEWNRRLEAYRAGRTQATPVDEVLARIRKKHDR